MSSQKTNSAIKNSLIKSNISESCSIDRSHEITNLKKDIINFSIKNNKLNSNINVLRVNNTGNEPRDQFNFDSINSINTIKRRNSSKISLNSTFLSHQNRINEKSTKKCVIKNPTNEILENREDSQLSQEYNSNKLSKKNSILKEISNISITKHKDFSKKNSKVQDTYNEKKEDQNTFEDQKEEELRKKTSKKKSTESSSNMKYSYLQPNIKNNSNVKEKLFEVSRKTWDPSSEDKNPNYHNTSSMFKFDKIRTRNRNITNESTNKYFENSVSRRTIKNKRSFLFDSNYRNSLIHHFNDDFGDAIQINNYRIIKELGEGSYGVVKLCQNINENNKEYAMKIVDKNKLKKLELKKAKLKKKYVGDMIDNEINILNKINHSHIVKCFEIIDTKDHQFTYFILEYMKNGSLKDLVNKGIRIEKIWQYFRHLLLGIEYCHEQIKLIHFDIKPDNLLIDENNQLKITDFGISHQFKDDDDTVKYHSKGTPFFKAPEMTYGESFQGKPCDIWSMGVTLYYCIYKIYPFYVSNPYEVSKLYEKIRKDELVFPESPDIGDNLKDLISKMLTKDPKSRIKLSEIIFHPWVTKYNKDPLSSCFYSHKHIKNNYFSDLLEDENFIA